MGWTCRNKNGKTTKALSNGPNGVDISCLITEDGKMRFPKRCVLNTGLWIKFKNLLLYTIGLNVEV
jgi:hypothetical protein